MINRPEFLKTFIYPRQSKLNEYLNITDAGASVWSKGETNTPLSEGCISCKNGTWLCIYVGHKCNASCDYCPQGNQIDKLEQQDHPDAAQSYWIDDLIRLVKFSPKKAFTGISYSGGEPFMYLDKIIKLATSFSKFNEHIYQWIYTNGMLASSDKMKLLADLNISEIRFHLGAFDFDEIVLNNVKAAHKIFQKVVVETPSCPRTAEKLKDGLLFKLEDMGVTQINLAEKYLNEKQITSYNNKELYYYSSAFRGQHISPIDSRISTYDVIDFAKQNNIDIIINDCSHESRDIQILTKRQNIYRQINTD